MALPQLSESTASTEQTLGCQKFIQPPDCHSGADEGSSLWQARPTNLKFSFENIAIYRQTKLFAQAKYGMTSYDFNFFFNLTQICQVCIWQFQINCTEPLGKDQVYQSS